MHSSYHTLGPATSGGTFQYGPPSSSGEPTSPDPHLFTSVPCSKLVSSITDQIIKTIFSKEHNRVITTTTINAVREFVWAYLSSAKVNAELVKSKDINAQITSQCLYSFCATLITAAIFIGCRQFISKCESPTNLLISKTEQLIICLIAAVISGFSVYTWDRSALVNTDLCAKWLNHNSTKTATASSYCGSILPGVTDGFVPTILSFIFYKLATCTANHFNQSFNSPYASYTKIDYLKKLAFYTIFPGSIPGAMWQVAFATAALYSFNAIETGLLVMSVATIASVIVSMLEQKFLDQPPNSQLTASLV